VFPLRPAPAPNPDLLLTGLALRKGIASNSELDTIEEQARAPMNEAVKFCPGESRSGSRGGAGVRVRV